MAALCGCALLVTFPLGCSAARSEGYICCSGGSYGSRCGCFWDTPCDAFGDDAVEVTACEPIQGAMCCSDEDILSDGRFNCGCDFDAPNGCDAYLRLEVADCSEPPTEGLRNE